MKGWIVPDWLAINWWRRLHYLPYAILAVAWCRFVLLSREVAKPTTLPRWHPRLGRFFIFLFLTILIFSLINRHIPVSLYEAYSVYVLNTPLDDDFLSTVEFNVLSPLILFLSLYILLRFSLLFPALAIDMKSTFRASWESTRGVSFRLLAVFILCFAPFHLVETIAYDAVFFLFIGQSSVFSSIGDRPFEFIESLRRLLSGVEFWGLRITTLGLSIVFLIFDYLWVGLIASMISIAFRTCTGWVPAVSTPPAQSGTSG